MAIVREFSQIWKYKKNMKVKATKNPTLLLATY
jgi:hypothetical protein